MADVRLFPRLAAVHARRLLIDPGISTAVDPDSLRSAVEPFVTWAPSGGRRSTNAELDRMRDNIRAVAAACGWPGPAGQVSRASFDAGMGAFLLESNYLPVAEALRDDVWSWIAIALVPDVCLWRFGGAAHERFLGGRRNTLQRLWSRARVFDRGVGERDRWELLDRLTEDAMVQITERPSLGADARLATAIGDAWIRTADVVGVSAMEALTREAVRNLRITNEVLCFGALNDKDLAAAIAGHFERAASAAALQPRQP